jgi:hypothetical protein
MKYQELKPDPLHRFFGVLRYFMNASYVNVLPKSQELIPDPSEKTFKLALNHLISRKGRHIGHISQVAVPILATALGCFLA